MKFEDITPTRRDVTATLVTSAMLIGCGIIPAIAADSNVSDNTRFDRILEDKVNDAVIEITAERGISQVSAEDLARRTRLPVVLISPLLANRSKFLAGVLARLFERRIAVYRANAITLNASTSSSQPGVDALARMFPDPLVVTFFDIAFALRNDPREAEIVQSVATTYDGNFVQIVPKFFPDKLPSDAIGFALLQCDGISVHEIMRGGRSSALGLWAKLTEVLDRQLYAPGETVQPHA